jgi:SAM-dependent methyltransferase
MYIVSRTARLLRSALLSYGPQNIKKLIWNKEFAGTKWNFIDRTVGDCVYPPLEKYARNGSILDLGCGPGNTANELNETSYLSYLGVDISEEALAKAVRRTEESGRAGKNRFATGDFLTYEPEGRFDVILFRESMYHVPIGRIRPLLNRYARHLRERGVFVVRMHVTSESGDPVRRPTRMVQVIDTAFDIIERVHDAKTGGGVVVFQPKTPSETGRSHGHQATTQKG